MRQSFNLEVFVFGSKDFQGFSICLRLFLVTNFTVITARPFSSSRLANLIMIFDDSAGSKFMSFVIMLNLPGPDSGGCLLPYI